MAKARIYRPDKSAMQSGKARMRHWVLEFAPEQPQFIYNLNGWVGSTDMPRQVILTFPTKEEAVAYADRQHIPYELYLPEKRSIIHKAYADNFKFNKIAG